MLWKRKDMGSDPINPIYVTTDIPIVTDPYIDGEFVAVNIPIDAYKRLVNWCSMGRTMDNVTRCLADGSPDTQQTHMAYQEMEMLRKSLEDVYAAIRNHYIRLPNKLIEKS